MFFIFMFSMHFHSLQSIAESPFIDTSRKDVEGRPVIVIVTNAIGFEKDAEIRAM
jgi:hypothetical protein